MNGFPDWKDKNQYPACKDDLTYQQWAWEFLRRNKEYQDAFYSNQQIPDQVARLYQGIQVARNYGLAVNLLDPFEISAGELPDVNIFIRYPRFSVHEAGSLERFQIGLTFDLTLPIDAQLREAGRILKDRIEEEKIPRIFSKKPVLVQTKARIWDQNLINYLRVLDAKKSGASAAEIAHVVYAIDSDLSNKYAGSTMVNNHYKAARKLCNGDYRKIYLRGDKALNEEAEENSGSKEC